MYSKEQKEQFESYLNIHLKKDQLELPVSEKIEALKKRKKSKWWQFAVNIAAILFFGYSFYYEITQLSETFFLIIFIVFGINVGLIIYQEKQIGALIEYLEWKRHSS